MPTYNTILYEKQRQGVLITWNRPETVNAISRELEHELADALTEAEHDPEVRAVVMTGMGRGFSSGYDIAAGRPETSWPSGVPEGQSAAELLDHWRIRSSAETAKLLQIWELSKPVIAAVSGWCVGGGSWYALACHMTYAAEDAVFAQPEVRMISNTSFFWVLNAGYKHALRYALTGDHIDAREALRIGLINDIVPKESLIDACFHIVERIARVSPETVKLNLAVATKGLEMMGLRNALSLNDELSAIAQSSQREDFRRHLTEAQKQGGMRAFLQQRDDPFRPEPFGPRAQRRQE
jgi:enoyl-CoA hydratase/carnithine racemase